MKKLLFFLLLVVVAVAPFTVTAQEPNSGGPILEGQPGIANIGSFNPLRCSGTDCQRIFQLITPNVLGVDPDTGEFTPNGPGGLATDWSLNEEGTQLTVTLRDDAFWSDGEPITSEDVAFTYFAIASGVVESDLTGFVDAIVTNVIPVDDYTVIFEYETNDCTALDVAGIDVIPAHVFGFDGDYENFDYSVMVDHPYDTEPTVSGGEFVWASTVPGQQINLISNQSYYGAPEGMVPVGYASVDVPDNSVELERFFAGELNFIDSPEIPRMQEIRDSGVQFLDFPALSYTYVAFNIGDPDNAVDATDEEGNIIEQPVHPIFGDVRVRQALTYAVDRQAIIDEVLNGEGFQIVGTEIPTSWAVHPDLQPYPFDLAEADRLLVEAGWMDSDGDGVRECNGCLYAEEGTPFTFTVLTNDSNAQRVDIGVVFQDQMRSLGIEVDFQAIDFNTLVDTALNQNFDAIILGWSLSYPANPDQTQIFGAAADTVGSGFNFTSWVNEEYISLNEQARTVEGCQIEDRAPLYHRMQEIVYEDAPYIFLYAPNDMYVAQTNVLNFDSLPEQPFWNVRGWEIQD